MCSNNLNILEKWMFWSNTLNHILPKNVNIYVEFTNVFLYNYSVVYTM